jgi:hypothetical protein
MKNLLELMRPEDRKKMIERYQARVAPSDKKNKISNEMFLLADFGLMFGWQAVVAVRNNEITWEEMYALLEAGHKVQSTHELDDAVMTTTAIGTAFAKKGQAQKHFNQGMKKHLERVE